MPIAYVIEDDVMLAEIFEEAVTRAGYETEVFQDGQVALDQLKKDCNPFLIVLDLHLPNVSGLKILEHIRSSAHLKDVQVIVASADGNLATMPEIAEGATLTLQKPVRYSQLHMLAKRLYPQG